MIKQVVISVTLGVLCLLSSDMSAQILHPVIQNGKWGYIDTTGRMVIAPQYEQAAAMTNGIAKAKRDNTLYIIFSPEKILELPGCTRLESIRNSTLYKLQKNGKWWMSDSSGNLISAEGFDRIWAVPGTSGRYFFSIAGETGVLDSSGTVLMRSEYLNLTRVSDGYYIVYTKKRVAILIDEAGERVGKDSFVSLTFLCDPNGIFFGKTIHGENKIFTKTGDVVAASKKLSYEILGNNFLLIYKERQKRIFDALRLVFIDSLKGSMSYCPLPDCITITNHQKEQRIFDRNRGFIAEGVQNLRVTSKGKITIFTSNGYFGLFSEENALVLNPVYIGIYRLNYDYFSVIDSSLDYKIFDAKNRKWVGNNPYQRVVFGEGFIKAYTYGSALDNFHLNAKGEIDRQNTYFNVKTVNVYSRSEANQLWVNGGNWSPWNPVNNEIRKTNWFTQSNFGTRGNSSTTLYGLRSYDSAQRAFSVYLNPCFVSVRVLSIAPLSIGGVNTGKNKYSNVANYRTVQITRNFVLVNDANGRKLTNEFEYIDGADCENNQSKAFRTSLNGKMYLISKSTLKVVGSAYYISAETSGVRRVCASGMLSAERSAQDKMALNDPDYLGTLGLVTDRIAACFVIKNGDWRIYRDGKMIKPEIAGMEKITFISEFKHGHAVVILANGKAGAIDTLGNTYIPADYNYVQFSPHIPGFMYAGITANKCGLANQYGEIMVPPTYSSIKPLGDVYIGKIKDSQYLFSPDESVQINRSAKAVKFDEQTGFVRNKNGYQLTQNMGNSFENERYLNVKPFNNGYAPVSKASLWGLIDENGRNVVKCKYNNAREFGYTAGIFERGTRWIFVDINGKKIPRPKGADAWSEIAPGLFVYINRKGKYGIYDENGKRISAFSFSECPIYLNGMVMGSRGRRVFFYTEEGAKDGVLAGAPKHKNKQFTLQRAENVKSDMYPGYQIIKFAPAQLRAFGLDSPWNEIMVPLGIAFNVQLQKNYLFEAYQNDVFLVTNSEYSFVNSNGERLVRDGFKNAEPMQNGMAICKTWKGQTGVLGKDGLWILEPQYNDVKRMNDSTFSYHVAYDFDIYDDQGNVISDVKSDAISFSNGTLRLQHENAVGYYRKGSGLIWNIQE